MTVITATFYCQTRSFRDHLGELGERRRGREVKMWRSAVGSTRLIRPSTDTWWRELQQAWRPFGSRPRCDRREIPAEGRALVPRDRGIDSVTCTGTQPSPQPQSLSDSVWFLVHATCFLLSWSFPSTPFSLAHSLPALWDTFILPSVCVIPPPPGSLPGTSG